MLQQILDFKAKKIQREAEKLQEERDREMQEEAKYKSEVRQRIKRNQKLKVQLEKWEKDKQQKEQRMLDYLQKQQTLRESEEKQKVERRKIQELKLAEYHQHKEQKQKENEELKKIEKRRFYEDIYLKKLRLKSEVKHLRQSQRDGVPRYDLRTNELVQSRYLGSISQDANSSITPSNRTKLDTHKLASLTRREKNNTSALAHLNTTISALGIYKNPLPSPRRYHM